MIYGVGIDIIKINRVRKILEKYGIRFRERLFTPAEDDYCMKKTRPYIHFATRFAAKEAFAKATGHGIRNGITWKDIEVLNEQSGKPVLNLYGPSADLCASLGIRQKLISISHEEDYGIAMVILEA
ncbi:MAG: holo-ACP synthase [Pseudomonadota bacterium]